MDRLDNGIWRRSQEAVDLMRSRPGIGFDFVPRSPLNVVKAPCRVVGAGVGAAAVGTAAAVTATQPWNWGGTGYYVRWETPHWRPTPIMAVRLKPVPTISKEPTPRMALVGVSGWADYKARNGIVCDPGTMIQRPLMA